MRLTSPASRGVRVASLSLAALVTAATLTSCGGDDSAEDPSTASGTTSASPTPSEEPTTAEPTPTEGGGVEEDAPTGTVPVYYVGSTGQGDRLFREFRKVSGEPGLGAAEMVASGSPLDPDYRSAFPDGSGFSSVSTEDGLVVVTLADDDWVARPGDMNGRAASLAVQSLVYTVQGALQTRDPVEVRDSSGAATTLLGVDTAGGVANADQLEVLSLVNVTSPEQDSEVSGSITASGVASSFEATVPWEVRDDSDAVVLNGFATAEGWMDGLYPWETEVDLSGLAPGTYTFLAMTSDPSGGEGNPPMFDTKQVTVG